MRLLLASFLIFPAFAQTPAAKPEEKPAAPAAEAKADDKKAESPVPTAEQWLTGSVDLGYRWISNFKGNHDVYRSVVNLGEGPRLGGLEFTLTDPKKRLFDRIDARSIGWGGDPYNTAHIDARKRGVYDLRFDYRNIAYYNALPSYANPGIVAGLVTEHSFDTHRRMSSVDLDLMPGHSIVPYFAYQRDAGRGRGVTTFVGDANEWAVPTTLADKTDNFRGGLRFEFRRFHATLEQGATRYADDQALYNGQANAGNRSSLINGQAIRLNSLAAQYGVTSESKYSKLLFTANPTSWADVYGQFLYSQPETDVHYTDTAAGSFVVLSSLLFYTGQQDLATGVAKAPHTSANFSLELRPVRRLRVVQGITTDRMHNSTFGLLAETLLLTGNTSQALRFSLNDRLVLNYNQYQADAIFDATSKLTLRGGYRYVWGDATVRSGTLSQTGPLESREMKRNVGLAGLTFRPVQKLSLNFDFEGGSSDSAYFRTSLYNYNRARIRTRYQAFGALAFQAAFSVTSNENPSPGIKYDFFSRDTSLSAYWTPGGGKRFSMTTEYSRSTLRSDINYLLPLGLFAERSFYRDNAHAASTVMDLVLPGYAGLAPKLSLGGSLFVSAGSRPSRYYQPLVRLSLPIEKHVYWNTEWRWLGYGEQFYAFEGFRAHVFQTGLRLMR
jgi:hypothetical protein